MFEWIIACGIIMHIFFTIYIFGYLWYFFSDKMADDDLFFCDDCGDVFLDIDIMKKHIEDEHKVYI